MRFQLNHADVLAQPKQRALRKKFDHHTIEKEAGWRHSSKKPLDLKVKDRGLLYRNDEMPSVPINNGALTSGHREKNHALASMETSPARDHMTTTREETGSLFKTATEKPSKALRQLIAGKFSNEGNNNYNYILPGATLVGQGTSLQTSGGPMQTKLSQDLQQQFTS